MNRFTAIVLSLLAATRAHAADGCGADFICFKKGHPTETEAQNFKLDGTNLIAVENRAALFNKYPQTLITLAGYTTPGECGKECDALAHRRAQIAYDALVSLGIDKSRMDVFPTADVQKLNSETLKRHPDDEHGALFYMHD